VRRPLCVRTYCGRGCLIASPEVHLFEPTGYAGVFQHACRVAQLLGRSGVRVVLHTGHEHEPLEPSARVRICACSWWPRQGRRSKRRVTLITLRYLARTLPHLCRTVPRGSFLHLQGIAATGGLNLAGVISLRVAGRKVVYSPHDTFSRRGRLDGRILKLALRAPDAVIVYTQPDVVFLRATGIAAEFSPLVQVVPFPSQGARARWRQEWGAADQDDVVLFAGWIRPEKRLDLIIESALKWPPGRRLAVLGQDRGAWDKCAALAKDHGIEIAARIEFVELEDFTSAIAAADVVVAPHERANQSGVLSLARQLGVRTVAADVGGLSELATRTFIPGDVDDLTFALDAELAMDRPPPRALDEQLALQVHLRAYGLEGASL
jgi:glycosyltransferase involved in cell wall biosynthesis